MRLLIAGTLTLVIYLMACAYGNKEKKATEIKYTQTSTPLFWLPSHERYSPLPFVMFYFHPQQHEMGTFHSNDTQIHIFRTD